MRYICILNLVKLMKWHNNVILHNYISIYLPSTRANMTTLGVIWGSLQAYVCRSKIAQSWKSVTVTPKPLSLSNGIRRCCLEMEFTGTKLAFIHFMPESKTMLMPTWKYQRSKRYWKTVCSVYLLVYNVDICLIKDTWFCIWYFEKFLKLCL